MFKKILIANRGEIACRIARTARRMGIVPVAVYSDADAHALHVRAHEQALRIGTGPATDSYLAIERIVDAAKKSGADAIHPGYGFLSENAPFAQACADAGLVFIGPSVEAIRVMGSKSEAKAVVARHEVPLVPGYYGEEQSPAFLAQQAQAIGMPILIKATAGGGGRGMRVVRRIEDFTDALASAQREAQNAFADPRVLLEKYVEAPRHIEVQVFGDSHGNVVHLFERDCSLQRRHQKVIEEAPAVQLSEAQREVLYRSAIAAAKSIRYTGAGTVEFVIAGDGSVYFIEMNTRLQVEHPVTEMITGLDLVEWQLRIAAGEPLPLAQDHIVKRGHAVEVRLYAEDPAQEFKPSIGRIRNVRLPPPSPTVRIDAGVESGDSITPFYDAMFAKLITVGSDREQALQAMAAALGETALTGVVTNVDYLQRIVTHPAYLAGGFTTHFVEDYRDELNAPAAPPTRDELLFAACTVLARRGGGDTPWQLRDHFRLNHDYVETLRLRAGDAEFVLELAHRRDGLAVTVDGETSLVTARELQGDRLSLVADGERARATVFTDDAGVHVLHDGRYRGFVVFDPLHAAEEDTAAAGSLTAPMPGAITAVMVQVGDRVARGAPLVMLEAMKIEHTIVAPFDGVVTEIRYAKGEQVAEEGAELVKLEPAG
ncbi:MAG: biotin carboxylase N-terminal domain-containing protein [Gammaproteobacteria bacterium]